MKFLKKMKNKKFKALAAALAMSTVMGVCGNAMAVSYYGTANGGWSTYSLTSGFNGVFDFTMTDNVYGGYCGGTQDNTVKVMSGIIGHVYGGYAYPGDTYRNHVYIYPGANVNYVTGGYAERWRANYNTVTLMRGSRVRGDVTGGVADYDGYQFAVVLADNNTVNVGGHVTVGGTVRVGVRRDMPFQGSNSGNTLNITGDDNTFGGLSDVQNINLT